MYICTYTHMYLYMHEIMIKKKRGHEFERQGGAYGRVCKKEREGRNGIFSKKVGNFRS